MLESVVYCMGELVGMGIAIGTGAGLTVILIDYVFTSIMSLMKGR